ncbi:unnamed protein product, partial [Tetraodon nigroviridis]
DEKNQVLMTNAWLQLIFSSCKCELVFPSQHWTDIYLTWNPENYPGVQNLRFPSDQVWTPDILSTTGQNCSLFHGTCDWGQLAISCSVSGIFRSQVHHVRHFSAGRLIESLVRCLSCSAEI